ncbi:hypothetical protein L3Y34_013187 [Caenorhabditis briggsae]|uniref:Deacetylase sirtuin-type domain-containing protein n=1 Tax=Caenorhabditis briggsae TaxID=6238 RepID=A0AAE8ZTR5_CAEBR|nr:hypothetical protein L3Y34_013187 [Caenorhabditis briggsae]
MAIGDMSSVQRVDILKPYQEKLAETNPDFQHVRCKEVPNEVTEMPSNIANSFNVPTCPCCGGIMKTDVTFFGETLSTEKLNFAFEKANECGGILTLGSSLAVLPGSRLVHQAHSQNKPIFIVNIGPTCVDHLATMKLENKISDVLKEI